MSALMQGLREIGYMVLVIGWQVLSIPAAVLLTAGLLKLVGVG